MESAAATAVPTAAQPPSSPADRRAEAIARTQHCFKELGYYDGPVDGITNEETWTAHWHFKREHGLIAHSDFLEEPVQRKLLSLCPEQQQATPEPEPEAIERLTGGHEEGQSPSDASGVLAGPAGLDVDCLPEALLSLLQRTQDRPIAVNACPAACLPAPKGLTEAALDKLKAQTGMAWCEACVPIEGHLALDDVRRIERAGNLRLCATPPTQLPRYEAVMRAFEMAPMRVRAFYRSLPPAAEDENAVALIIGNHNYTSLPVSQTSRADADAFYSLLTEHLGYRQDNIIDVRDAKREDLARIFGDADDAKGELSGLVAAHPEAKVVVYYSGWGATDGAQSETYLLPVNTVRYREEHSGYPLSRLYANLEALKARSVLLLLEADFGREHSPYLLPPNMPETVKSVLPPAPVPGLTVLAAADQGQRALIDVSYGLGLFTRYLIEGLSGDADLAPIGNGDGRIDSIELYVYAAERVQLTARKSFGLLQRPAFSGAAAMTVSSGARVSANAN